MNNTELILPNGMSKKEVVDVLSDKFYLATTVDRAELSDVLSELIDKYGWEYITDMVVLYKSKYIQNTLNDFISAVEETWELKYGKYSDAELCVLKNALYSVIDDYKNGVFGTKEEYLKAIKMYTEMKTELKKRGVEND